MIAAIYARKSTEQTGADPDAKSVARQIENARAFAASKGWTVDDRHVYADDAVSGADTQKLVNRQRLLDAISVGPLFQVLILRDASRFSRLDGDEAFGELKSLVKAGVAVWFYQDGTPFTFGTFGDNVVGFVRAEMNAEYRRQIGKYTREAMDRKARAGHVTGGRTFGYDNVRIDGHVERRINSAEANIVRQIFARSAAGDGYGRIAKTLNEARAACPRPQQGRPSGWSPSTVYEVLHRPLYRGDVVWNKTKKRGTDGKIDVTTRPKAEWLTRHDDALRIIAEDVWGAVHERFTRRLARIEPGRRAVRDLTTSKYLLSGFARCATCGGALSVLTRSHGRRRAAFYGCLAHHKRGATVCDNALVLPIDCVDDAVLQALAGDVLRPAVVTAIIEAVFAELEPTKVATTIDALRAELRALDQKIANLTTAVEDGAPLAPLVAKLTARQTERDTLIAAIGAADARAQIQLDRRDIERQVLAQVSAWRTLLTSNVDDGRQLLREVLTGPLRFAPDGKRYRFKGDVATGALIAGLVGLSPYLASPTGFEPVF